MSSTDEAPGQRTQPLMRDSKRLLSVFRSLSEPRQQALLEYAKFLAGKEEVESTSAPASEPLPIPRPEQENVVKAIPPFENGGVGGFAF